ncbi:hypothetical protein [Cyclobacterium plantarum]|uniref:Uncharacterized protein n=1 Tax=Cyclobacterium plantarum TaxID=2716263 RepID=A0ABX0HI29_9BACT|nr:hypothetical protein [Cyclobacterium plantarum]NHE59812.1 hypothetical protein [Cyclobacterium plantarum]
MVKIVKPFVGVCLAILMVFQAYFSGSAISIHLAEFSNTVSYEPAYDDFSGPIALTNEGLQTQSQLPKNIFDGGDLLVSPLPQILIHFGRSIQSSFSNARTVIIKFGIREALFPSHYFW